MTIVTRTACGLRAVAVANMVFTLLMGAIGCSSAPRAAAKTLAANSVRLNDQIEAFTRARRQIEVARTRLTDQMELSSMRTQDYNQRQVDAWDVLKESDKKMKLRVTLFDAARKHVDTATAREAEIGELDRKLFDMSDRAKGQRSEKLAETAKLLGTLSANRSLKEQLEFLSGYVQSVQSSLEEARKDAKAAADNTEAKANDAEKKAKNAKPK